ncbi:uncharacterized protein VTP21DRAFT_6600 [Calcarisporiella thermophila]|uniref:uncharacterized protein n=1 Tax=Calcarisporiella thermophila TaxID=911321 RepID=UPI003742055F
MHEMTPRRLEAEIVPGKSVGWFKLGMSVWDICERLKEQVRVFPNVEFKYSQDTPLSTDFILSLTQNGINLRFEPLAQRLKLIEIFDFERLKLTYQGGGDICSVRTDPTFLVVYKLFGPTYPGEFDKQTKRYILGYPGISFTFPISDPDALTSSAELPIELPDGTSPIASHAYIYQGASTWLKATLPSLRFPGELESAVAMVGTGLSLQFVKGGGIEGVVDLKLGVTTPQDAISALGSANRVWWKEEDKMRIHSLGEERESIADGEAEWEQRIGPICSSDYFYNYFALGIDLLFDSINHLCKKIVIHGNVPGHFDFQRYKRCPYRIVFPNRQTPFPSTGGNGKNGKNGKSEIPESADAGKWVVVESEMKIDQIRKLVGSEDGVDTDRPVIFNRVSAGQNPFGSSVLTGYNDGVVLEVMKNGHIATVVLF